jgi:phytoene desaturase
LEQPRFAIFTPYFVGFDKKIENVAHHSLSVDFDIHAKDIYDKM